MKPARCAPLIAAALFAALVLTPRASATYDPLGGGATKLTLDKGFLALLRQEGVKLSTVVPARLKGGAIVFPVSGGKFDPTDAKGTVEHGGALVFRAGSRAVPLRALQLKTTQPHAPLSAKVGGGQLKIASAARLSVAREGFGDRVKVRDLELSAKFAERLDKKLHLHGAFAEGQAIGSALTKTKPVTVAVEGAGKAAFTPSAGILAKLASLFVAVNPIFPAEHPDVTFTLPIFGGTIAPDASSGTLETGGSLELLQLRGGQGGGQLLWHEIWADLAGKMASAEVDVEPSPPYAGKTGRIPLAGLGGGTVSSDPRARTVKVENAAVILQAGTAQTLNQLFAEPMRGGDVFAPGELLGTLSFVALGQ